MEQAIKDTEKAMDDMARNIDMPSKKKINDAFTDIGILAIAAMDAAELESENYHSVRCFRAVSTVKLAFTKRGHEIEELKRRIKLLEGVIAKEVEK
jgi:ATP phosphoribosyltransferase regulatory subunit HisZ